jgi:hypothetical protein
MFGAPVGPEHSSCSWQGKGHMGAHAFIGRQHLHALERTDAPHVSKVDELPRARAGKPRDICWLHAPVAISSRMHVLQKFSHLA